MVSEHVRQALRSETFRPFALHLTDDRTLEVRHPEFAYVPPRNERTIYVTDEDGDVEVVDALMIVSLKPLKARRNGRPRRGG